LAFQKNIVPLVLNNCLSYCFINNSNMQQ
jgi:hypothetical protein